MGRDVAGFTTLWGSFLLCSSLCTIFIVSFWKSQFQEELNVSDSDMQTMLLVLDMLAFFTYLAGLILDHVGPVTLIFGSALLNASGYGVLALVAYKSLAVGFAYVGFVLAGQGSIWCVVASLGLVGRNVIPQHKGMGIGLAMAWFSLSACAVKPFLETFGATELYAKFLGIGGLMVAMNIVTAFAIGSSTAKGHQKRNANSIGFAWNLGLTIVMTTGVFVAAYSDDFANVMQYVFVVLIFVWAAALLGGGVLSRRQVDHEVEGIGALVAGEAASSTVGEALRDIRYWLVFGIFAMLVSTGMLVNNSVVELAKAANLHSDGMISSAFAVGNTLSRVFFGYCSDVMAKRISRHWFLVMDAWLMVLAYFLLYLSLKQETAPSTMTAVAVFLGGFSFGAPWMMVPAIEMHWYGMAKFGAIHGIMMFATAVGLILVRVGETAFDDLEGVVIFCLVSALVISVLGTLGFLAKEAADRRKSLKAGSGA